MVARRKARPCLIPGARQEICQEFVGLRIPQYRILQDSTLMMYSCEFILILKHVG